jgi:hypothetical protein
MKEPGRLKLFMEIIVRYSETHTKHTHTHSVRKMQSIHVKATAVLQTTWEKSDNMKYT